MCESMSDLRAARSPRFRHSCPAPRCPNERMTRARSWSATRRSPRQPSQSVQSNSGGRQKGSCTGTPTLYIRRGSQVNYTGKKLLRPYLLVVVLDLYEVPSFQDAILEIWEWNGINFELCLTGKVAAVYFGKKKMCASQSVPLVRHTKSWGLETPCSNYRQPWSTGQGRTG